LPELTTNQKGAIAETAIVKEATRLGIEVYRPVAEGGRFDLIFLLGDALARVRCKWAPRQGDVILVRCYSCRRAREGMRVRRYTADEIDVYAAYCAENDRCYYLTMARFGERRAVQLRLAPSRNKQQLGIHWAADYEFAATIGAAGP
jgi:hypothetical protein